MTVTNSGKNFRNCSHQVMNCLKSPKVPFKKRCILLLCVFKKLTLYAVHFEIGFHSSLLFGGEWVISLGLESDDKDLGESFTGGVKMSTLNSNAFSSNLNTINLTFFHTVKNGRIYSFVRKFNKNYGKIDKT